MSHAYGKLEETPLLEVINKGIADVFKNGDIEELTGREYIVGYLCKIIYESEKRNQ